MLEISAAPRVMTKMTFDKHNCCIVIILTKMVSVLKKCGFNILSYILRHKTES